ncbi:MAG: hypothetical protein JJU00_17040 [Opitutales bacterium]|nr:hypothetical protein [Opitutales bacterium]
MLTHTLRKTPMFAGIAGEPLERLVEGCHLQNVSKGGYLFHEDKRVVFEDFDRLRSYLLRAEGMD